MILAKKKIGIIILKIPNNLSALKEIIGLMIMLKDIWHLTDFSIVIILIYFQRYNVKYIIQLGSIADPKLRCM